MMAVTAASRSFQSPSDAEMWTSLPTMSLRVHGGLFILCDRSSLLPLGADTVSIHRGMMRIGSMNTECLAPVIGLLKSHWHRKETRFFGPLVVFVVACALALFGGVKSSVAAIGALLLAASFWATWSYFNRIPKLRKAIVGIVVGVACETPEHRAKVHSDFVLRLKEVMEGGTKRFEVLELPPFAARDCQDAASALRYLAKARSHFMIYGSVRERALSGKSVHVMHIEGLVRHAPVPDAVRQDLSNDFGHVLPRKVLVPSDGDFLGFEVTSELVDVSARFVIGVAAMISGDLIYAESLLLDVERRLRTRTGEAAPSVREIMRRLPARFDQLYRLWINHLSERFVVTRNKEYLQTGDGVSGKLLQRDPRSYNALLHRAICEFVLRRNVKGARSLLKLCNKEPDGTWLYSTAFLNAYEGKMKQAKGQYRRAFKMPCRDATVALQCEEFIQMVVEEEPERSQLWFVLGYLNLYAKRDPVAAHRDFQKFLGHPESGKFPEEVDEAKTLLAKSLPHDGPDEPSQPS